MSSITLILQIVHIYNLQYIYILYSSLCKYSYETKFSCFWLQATAKHIFKRIDLQGTGRFQLYGFGVSENWIFTPKTAMFVGEKR